MERKTSYYIYIYTKKLQSLLWSVLNDFIIASKFYIWLSMYSDTYLYLKGNHREYTKITRKLYVVS